MESGVWNSIPSLGFTSKNDINKHVLAWYSIPMLVLNHAFGIVSEFPRYFSVLLFLNLLIPDLTLTPFPSLGFTSKNDVNKHVWYSISSLVFNPNVGIFGSQAWFSIPMLVLNHKFGIGSD